jgi:hypothetical protein
LISEINVLNLFQKAEGELGKPGDFSREERVPCSGLVLPAASEDVCWDFGDRRPKADKTESVVQALTSAVPHTPELPHESEVDQERIYCNLVELAADPVYENQRYKLLGVFTFMG